MDTVGTEEMNQRGTLFAICLIVAGVILFLDNIDVLPINNIAAYLPMAFVVYGIGLILRKTSVTSIIWATALGAFGVLLTLGNLGIVHANLNVIWPILLIAFGVTALVHRGRWADWQNKAFVRSHEMRRWERKQRRDNGHEHNGSYLHDVAVFFSVNRRMEGREVQKGEIVAVFGSVEMDFNGAIIPLAVPANGGAPVRVAEIEATAVFGSIEIRVPNNWRVIKDAAGVFGSYEDRTIPYRPEPGVEPPTLMITGGAVFGSVTIEN